MKNTYTIIDSHCHVYPEKIAAKAVESTDHFYDTHAFGQGTVTDLLTKGSAAGCDGYVIQSVASTPHHVESINRFIATVISDTEAQGIHGKLTGLGTLHPDHPDLRGAVCDIMSHGLTESSSIPICRSSISMTSALTPSISFARSTISPSSCTWEIPALTIPTPTDSTVC